ncbi:MAG: DUF2252 domain-containing protein [Synechococcaceae bacterium WB4_1_0192]|jgi:uncharacterized protein (DUF2252 family)|nr:DUF2252 domain-containing protein [Synechococcaceae bacterium WB4_1_0192]
MQPPVLVDRPNPIDLMLAQEESRLDWLLPVRHSRMAVSAFTFFRGTAVVMAADLARQPHSGVMVQLCGDAHLLNFGFYASPERHLLFDLNDFDETHPGPFEWDVQRLAGSMVLAARDLNLSVKQQEKVCRRTVRAYAKAMAQFAAMPVMEMWVMQLDLVDLIEEAESKILKRHVQSLAARAQQRNSRQAVSKLCEKDLSGELRFRHDPPLIFRFSEFQGKWLDDGLSWQQWHEQAFQLYLDNIRPELRTLLSNFQHIDSAFKAVGIGSVGMRCAVGLWMDQRGQEMLVFQGKQAQPSVLAPYVNLPVPDHQGQRVVQGQRLMQTASDPFLGWTSTPAGNHYYWRQFRDWKLSVDVSLLDAEGLSEYGQLCAWTLAKAHARSGDRGAICEAIGSSKAFAGTVLEQALGHADQAQLDHQSLLSRIARGEISTSAVF